MKKVFILISLWLMVGCVSMAPMPSIDDFEITTLNRIEANSSCGLIYFYRPSHIIGRGTNYFIHDGNDIIGASRDGSYFSYCAPPGQHLFWGETDTKKSISLNVEASAVYYIEAIVIFGGMIGIPDFNLVPQEIGARAVRSLDYVTLRK